LGGEGGFSLLGQQQAAQAAGRIGQCRGDGMRAVQPDRTLRCVGTVPRALVLLRTMLAIAIGPRLEAALTTAGSATLVAIAELAAPTAAARGTAAAGSAVLAMPLLETLPLRTVPSRALSRRTLRLTARSLIRTAIGRWTV
jgi:hypothetical protein